MFFHLKKKIFSVQSQNDSWFQSRKRSKVEGVKPLLCLTIHNAIIEILSKPYYFKGSQRFATVNSVNFAMKNAVIYMIEVK
jgi:hypothetical protein